MNYDKYKKLPSFVPFVCAEGTGIVPLDLVEVQTAIFFQMLARPGTVPWHLRLVLACLRPPRKQSHA